MTGTIGYDESGAVFPPEEIDHDSYEAPESTPYGLDAGEVETSEDGVVIVRDVFVKADEFFAKTDIPEGIPFAPELDPEATGDDALKHDYSNYDGPHYEPSEEEAAAQESVEDAVDVQEPVYESGVGEVADGEVHRQDVAPDGEPVADKEAAKAEAKKQFDPSEHSVAEVNAYLASADEDEQMRVLEAEEQGKNRSTVKIG